MDTASETIRFYLDNHISKVVVIQLRRRDIDVLHCGEVGLYAASDLEHLEYATNGGHVLVTQDRDFLRIDDQWQRQSRKHSGIMILPGFLQGQAQIRYLVSALVDYHEFIQAGAISLEADIINQVVWL